MVKLAHNYSYVNSNILKKKGEKMFIELDFQKGKKIKINVDHILDFIPKDEIKGSGTKIETVNLRNFFVVNSYEDVSKKIDAALIFKTEG